MNIKQVIAQAKNFPSIANAIRNLTRSEDTIKPENMASEINTKVGSIANKSYLLVEGQENPYSVDVDIDATLANGIQDLKDAKTKIEQMGGHIEHTGRAPSFADICTKWLPASITTIPQGGGEANVEPLNITTNGTYEVPSGVDGFNPVTTNIPELKPYLYGRHVDENGIWHKPDDWDDIESIELPRDKDEVYILIDPHFYGDNTFLRLRFAGSGLYWSYGRIVNGQYRIHTTSTRKSFTSGQYVVIPNLNDFEDDYLVLKFEGTKINYIQTSAAAVADNGVPYAFTNVYNPILMRYGRMSGCSNLLVSSYTIESDNIIDCCVNNAANTTVTVASAYANSYELQRLRLVNNNFKNMKITSIASMFSTCRGLVDVQVGSTPNVIDLREVVNTNCTHIGSFMYNCHSFNGEVWADNWDLTNVTNTSSAFYLCYNLRKITGIDTWVGGSKVTTMATMFYNCYNLENDIDLSSTTFGADLKLTTVANTFQGLQKVKKINVGPLNLSKATTVTYAFSNLFSIKELNLSQLIPPTSVCTSFASTFQGCNLTELELDGWDFSGATTFVSIFQDTYYMERLKFTNCNFNHPTITAGNMYLFRYAYMMRELDLSDWDFSKFTSTSAHTNSFNQFYRLVDFYPPQNIGVSINFSGSQLLSHESLMRIINNLATVTNGSTFTMGAVNQAKLTTEEKALITGKGWKIA